MDRHPTVLLLPGSAVPPDWMPAWRAAHGDPMVEQADWELPLRGDWLCRLEEAAHAAPPGPLLLVGHGLGCQLAMAWGGTSAQAARVRAALLIDPAELHPGDGRLRSWLAPHAPPPFSSIAAPDGTWPDWRARLLAAVAPLAA